MRENSLPDMMALHLLRQARAEGRVSLATQPVVLSDHTDTCLYQECFARLARRDGSLANTQDFVVALEKAGAAPAMDLYMLELVLGRLAADPTLCLGMNLSTQNLESEQRWAMVVEKIRAASDVADRLVLEITETQPWSNPVQAANMLAQLRKLGCRIALDDFGAGFASPTRLLDVVFDVIKIDKAFVTDVRQARSGENSLACMIRLATTVGPRATSFFRTPYLLSYNT